MKTIYLILGSIGSGKSVVSDYISSDTTFANIEYVGSDIYKKRYFDRDVKIDKKGYRCADELAFYRIEQICQSEKDFLFEFCPTDLNKVETIKRILRKHDYKIVAFFIGTENKEINVERCKKRENDGADNVSEEKIKSRYTEAMIRVFEIADQAEKMYFIDNSMEIPKLIACLDDNILTLYEDTCKWFNKIYSDYV